MNDYQISVIIPVYNNEQHIENCIRSIFAQTISDKIEIVCVIDGSKDKSEDILRRLSKEQKILILTQDNSGAGRSRNRGLEECSGQYCMFVDGDDFIAHDDSIEKLYNAIEKYGLDIVLGNMVRLINHKYVTHIESGRYWNSNKKRGLVSIKDFPFPGVHFQCMYRKSYLIENKILYPKNKRGQDLVFCANALAGTEQIYNIGEYVYVYRANYKKVNYSYESAYDYMDSLFNMLKTANKVNGWKSLCRKIVRNMRIFSIVTWYKILEEYNNWDKVDEINVYLLENNYSPRLLNRSEYSKKTVRFYFEKVYAFCIRAFRFIQKKIFIKQRDY